MKESLVGSLRANGHSLLNCLRVWKWVGELVVIRVCSGESQPHQPSSNNREKKYLLNQRLYS